MPKPVTKASRPNRSYRVVPFRLFSTLSVGLILGLLLAFYWFTKTSFGLSFYWLWLVTLSLLTFGWYGFDKRQAQRGGLRVPELLLHLLALGGGFAGGWLGRTLFHHKTKKSNFTAVLVFSTLLHFGLAVIFIKLI
jgi:uncharacterized membrane protein YsdA (DUF1294 family)